MITLRTKRSGNALLVVASRFVRDVTIITCHLAIVNPIILLFYVVHINKGYIGTGVFCWSWLRLGLDFGLRLHRRHLARASGFESWPS